MLITISNFKDVLANIGFMNLKGKHKNIWLKSYPNCELRVDFKNNLLIYPEDKGFTINGRQTCNMGAPENFVVFECIDRLLSKGYMPEHIELEAKWKVGHGASGGRADILIKDNSGNPLLLIECKTWGTEFETEWKNMNLNGGQLFSYAQQIKSTQFLCLYTSGYSGEKVLYNNYVVTIKDNVEYLKTLNEPLTFSDATDVQALFKAWHVTYNHEYETTGIFENGHPAYEIGKSKRTALELQDINHDDIQKKYHEFATILRQHNVSGRENAFDKLVNLFLAKIVDEMQNPDELLFYWRGVAFDNYYNLQDRIQRLYRDGMQKFLNEEVTYIDNDDIRKTFRLFKNDPDATRDQIEEYFRQLKFYTNNDFAFLDVHNQHLFLQNSAILLKIIRMIQDIKLKTEEQNQFLGDLFEGFLDQGVKQSEGQFFTPTPIVKFLVSSLPLETLINENTEPLNVIDYACGAGHFLNEYATQIRSFLSPSSLPEYYKRTVGIEKEYRLSKVAKVSAFMYGQDEIQIVYADALTQNPKIKNGAYNLLISNPPYSVKGFLETLTPEERTVFEIFKVIDSKNIYSNNSIEVFFVERAKQLLAPGGVAAIILPYSLLSNSGAAYTKAREIILQYFDIVAITEFGSGTFGKTGTTTVALFLRRKKDNPSLAEHYRNRVDAWFNADYEKDEVFVDSNLLESYCHHIGYDIDDYKTLLNSTPNNNLLELDEFKLYRNAFDNLAETKKRISQKTFQALQDKEQQKELLNRFITFSREIEKEKLYYFLLAFNSTKNVVVVKSPSGTTNSKNFLGYEWSTRKGSEGIKYIGVPSSDDNEDETLSRLKGIKRIQTPLFNPSDLNDISKINTIIRNNFDGIDSIENEYVQRYRLIDMLDFSGVKFEKQISLSASKINEIEIIENFDRYRLSDKKKFSLSIGKRILNTQLIPDGEVPVYSANVFEPFGRINELLITDFSVPSILWGVDGDWQVNYIPANQEFYPTDHCGVLRVLTDKIHPRCLAWVMDEAGKKYGFTRTLRASMQRIGQLVVQLPNIDIQQRIVDAWKIVDEEYEQTRMSDEEYHKRLEQIFNLISGINK
jgi:type I restriction-modification system DNA methylase subunit